jgi:ABC-type Zn uptake system ZnuABC Zn-binding protein ZnuA
MKKLKTILILLILLLTATSCDSKSNDGLNILTTVYPITYLTTEIYTQGNVTSIYPDGADVENYNLTSKQIKEYSKNNIFIYNGLANELTTAKNLLNKNRKLKIIDVAYGLKYNDGVEELWLSPNYYLMLATTIKDNLESFTNSKYANEEIEKKYKELEETLSLMDAELRSIASSAKDINKETIVVSSNMFKYLSNYGFNVISLEDEDNLKTISLNNIKNNFKNGTYTTIFMKDTEEKTELINSLETEYGAKIVEVDTMTTLSTEKKDNNENYLTIMNNYLENIRNATLGE